jgi:hypothetical protein
LTILSLLAPECSKHWPHDRGGAKRESHGSPLEPLAQFDILLPRLDELLPELDILLP